MSKANKLRVPEYLEHILKAIRRIHVYIEDMAEAQFLEDEGGLRAKHLHGCIIDTSFLC